VGGYLTDAVSWRAVFLVNLPLGLFVITAANRHVPETRDPTVVGGLDFRGAALLTWGIGALCFALIQSSEGPAEAVIIALAVGLLASASFVRAERRSHHPMLPLEVFSSRQFTSANLLALLTYTALGGVIFLWRSFRPHWDTPRSKRAPRRCRSHCCCWRSPLRRERSPSESARASRWRSAPS
jgi:hypothetical protein